MLLGFFNSLKILDNFRMSNFVALKGSKLADPATPFLSLFLKYDFREV